MRRLATARAEPDRLELRPDRTGDYVVATERATGDSGTLWAATRIGRVFVSKNANDRSRATSASAGSTRRARPAASSRGSPSTRPTRTTRGSRTPATTRSRRHDGPRVRGPVRPADGHGDLRRALVRPRRPAGHGVAFFGATGDVYAATDFGVLRLPRGASHWESAGSGLPSVAVYGLTLSQSANVLYAASHGRGAWALTLPRP